MHKWASRLLVPVLVLTLVISGFAGAQADDWRDILRSLYGLTDDTDTQDQSSGAPEQGQTDFELPVIDPQQIVNYLDLYGELPENFITKKEAQRLGWDSRYNYVGDVAPGKSIGGGRFGNYEGLLPSKKGRQWYECDAWYRGRERTSCRVLYSSDGLYYYTDDHYRSFTQMFPEG